MTTTSGRLVPSLADVGAIYKCHPACKVEMTPPLAAETTSAWITAKHRIGIKLLLSVTGEAEAGSAGEQPAEE